MNRRELLKASLVLPLAGLLKAETPENKAWLIRSRNPVIDNSPYVGRRSTLNFKSSEAFISPCESDWDLNLRIVCGCGTEMIIEHPALAGMTEDGWLSYTCSGCNRKYRINMPFLLKQPREVWKKT